jgi:Sulfotransferase family
VASDAPVIVLGFSRSGTTLLKQMLDRHPELAIPTESYFLPQLWDRHGERPDREAFLDDLPRLARLRDWGVTRADVAERLPAEPSFPQAVQAIYRAYADARGKRRFGDKTPSYMQELDLLERAFPDARYVHLIRDGRDAALSFLALTRRPSFNWARPRGVGSVAVQWRREVEGARRFGRERVPGRYRELRYEDLVADPEARLREVGSALELEFDPAMLAYHEEPDAGTLRDHPKLAEPPTAGLRSWRDQMDPGKAELFEAVAGDLLAELGYERAHPSPSTTARARALANRAALAARSGTWNAALGLARRSPVWRLRQAYNRRRFKPGETP